MKAIDYKARCLDLETIISTDQAKHDAEIDRLRNIINMRDATIATLEDCEQSMTDARDEYARLARAYLIRLQIIDPEGYGKVSDGLAVNL